MFCEVFKYNFMFVYMFFYFLIFFVIIIWVEEDCLWEKFIFKGVYYFSDVELLVILFGFGSW